MRSDVPRKNSIYTVAMPNISLFEDNLMRPNIREIIIASAVEQSIWAIVIPMPLNILGEKLIKNSK